MMVAPRMRSVAGACCAWLLVSVAAKRPVTIRPMKARRAMRMMSSLSSFVLIPKDEERLLHRAGAIQSWGPQGRKRPYSPPTSSVALLLRFNAGRLDDLRPFRAVTSEDRGGRLRRGGGWLEAERIEALLGVGQGDGIADLAIEQSHDISRRAGRREHADPEIALHVREARFRHGGNLGQRREPLSGRDRERTQLAVLGLRD